MLKTMLAVMGVTMAPHAVPAAPTRSGPAPAAIARAPVAANAQSKVRGVRRVKARTASADSPADLQQKAAVYIPRCYDCPM